MREPGNDTAILLVGGVIYSVVSKIKIAANFDIIWKYFGFVKEKTIVDCKKVACRLCHSLFKYCGNTTNLTDHIRRKHLELLSVVNSSSGEDLDLATLSDRDITCAEDLVAVLTPLSPKAGDLKDRRAALFSLDLDFLISVNPVEMLDARAFTVRVL